MNTTWSRRSVLAAGVAAAACSPPQATTTEAPVRPILGGVRRVAPGLDALISVDAQVEEIGSGFDWSEGPLWIKEQNMLLFTDVPGNVAYKWTEAGGVEEFLRPSGFAGEDRSHLREPGANGLARDASGAVIMADCGNRRLSRLDIATKQKTPIVEAYQGKKFNSPNDVVVHSNGALYFTDPPYGLEGMADSPLRELNFCGVFKLETNGTLRVVDRTVSFPNGVALSPDERTLYVSCSDGDAPYIRSYALGADGMPTSSRLFFDAKPLQADDAPGNPDGMAIDAAGNIYCTGPGGVLVISPTGELLGVIGAGRAIANCKFGEDGSTLFLTADDKLARVRTLAKGLGY